MNCHKLILELPSRAPLEIIYSDISSSLKEIDALMMETNYGFNSFGMHCKLLAQEMNLNHYYLQEIGDSLLKEKIPTINIIKSKAANPTLKALALLSNPNCDSYKPFNGLGQRPSKDFFYNITYESLANLIDMGFTNIGIAGLTGSLLFINDNQYKNSVAEAISHIANDYPALNKIQILNYGPFITYGINYFNLHKEEAKLHKMIQTNSIDLNGLKKITLNIR